jgi:transposase
MPQIHHKNAKTNLHFRKQICNSSVKNDVLAKQFSVSKNTISKWKKRKGEDLNDHSSRPKNIHYALSPQVMAIACTIRKTFWSSVDQIQDELQKTTSDKFSRSSFSRLFVRENINKNLRKYAKKQKNSRNTNPDFCTLT